jgi:hypothetical protein
MPGSYATSTTNFIARTQGTNTPTDLGTTFCFSITQLRAPVDPPAQPVSLVIPSGNQYQPGTILTLTNYSTGNNVTIVNSGFVNGSGDDQSINNNIAQVYVACFFDGEYTHWVRIYNGAV